MSLTFYVHADRSGVVTIVAKSASEVKRLAGQTRPQIRFEIAIDLLTQLLYVIIPHPWMYLLHFLFFFLFCFVIHYPYYFPTH